MNNLIIPTILKDTEYLDWIYEARDLIPKLTYLPLYLIPTYVISGLKPGRTIDNIIFAGLQDKKLVAQISELRSLLFSNNRAIAIQHEQLNKVKDKVDDITKEYDILDSESVFHLSHITMPLLSDTTVKRHKLINKLFESDIESIETASKQYGFESDDKYDLLALIQHNIKYQPNVNILHRISRVRVTVNNKQYHIHELATIPPRDLINTKVGMWQISNITKDDIPKELLSSKDVKDRLVKIHHKDAVYIMYGNAIVKTGRIYD